MTMSNENKSPALTLPELPGTRLVPVRFDGQEASTGEWVEIQTPLKPGEYVPDPIPSNFKRLRTEYPPLDPTKLYLRWLHYGDQVFDQTPVVGDGSSPVTNYAKIGGKPGYPVLEIREQ